jgi:hypothetical protein
MRAATREECAMSNPRPPFPLLLFALAGLTSCETLTELGKSMDQAGASLVRSLQAPPPASETVEVVQPLASEWHARRDAGELRAALAVSDPGLAEPAGAVARALKAPPQGEPLVVAADGAAAADAWFAALAEQAGATELPESEWLLAAHLASADRPGPRGEARRELRLELRAFDRASQQPVFAARAVADDPLAGAAAVPARVAQLAAALVAKVGPAPAARPEAGAPPASGSARAELRKALLALAAERLAATEPAQR